MKTVIFVITKSEIGGAQTWVYEQATLLKDECHLILITSKPGWLSKQGVFNEVITIPGLIKRNSLSSLLKIVFLIRNKSADVVIASSANAGIYTRLAKLFCDFKCIYVSHGWSCIYNGGKFKPLLCKIEKVLSNFTDTIWCISKCDEKKAIKELEIKPHKIKTIINAITPMKSKTEDKFKGKILFVGRLTHPKRPDLIAEVVAENPKYRLDIIGDGIMKNKLEQQFSSTKNIRFLGEIENFRDFNKYDIFVLTSESEGLPMSGLEAGSAGIPMVLSNVGGCVEVINGKNGILVNNDKNEILAALEKIEGDYSQYLSSARTLKDRFDINSTKELRKQIILNHDR
ncbi:glycosyltransferase [Plesiomonas shigelloides]|uniref:glycosyltransferase n=1 Tax=Plesiomonas shigelloides TaxID=703 RepID=UPI002246A593|nr:glycosyltransferase [Plesiomonas shigelloides]MCX2534397.1 glycosyltransferase [Plesiomonas shigelloides]